MGHRPTITIIIYTPVFQLVVAGTDYNMVRNYTARSAAQMNEVCRVSKVTDLHVMQASTRSDRAAG